MVNLSELDLKEGLQVKVQGWFVSLFEFKNKPLTRDNLFITGGDQLIPLIGGDLIEKLRSIKESFK